MSWPFGPEECPSCRFFEAVEPPLHDDAGYEIVGGCRHPRIATDLFLFRTRDPRAMEPCPCFSRVPPGESPRMPARAGLRRPGA
jgi:hypothetical protein